jgi:AraC-like DNA-binding protein
MLESNISLLAQVISADIFIFDETNQSFTFSTARSDIFNMKNLVSQFFDAPLDDVLLVTNINNFYLIQFRAAHFLINLVPHINTTNVNVGFKELLKSGRGINNASSLIYQLLTNKAKKCWKYKFQDKDLNPGKINFINKQQIEVLINNQKKVLNAIATFDEDQFIQALKLPNYASYMGKIFESRNYERGMKDILIHFLSILFNTCIQTNFLEIDLVLKAQDDLLGKIEFQESSRPFILTMNRLAMQCFEKLKQIKEITNLALPEKTALYIKSHIFKKIDLDILTNYLGYSASTISHKFKAKYKISVMAYINQEKIEAAKRMLATKVLKPTEISNLLSFSSPSYFNYVFKKLVGIAPSEYRKEKLTSK